MPTITPAFVAAATTRDAADLMDQVASVIFLACCHGFYATIKATAPNEWEVSRQLTETSTGDQGVRLFGYLLGLQALECTGVGGLLVHTLYRRIIDLVTPAA